MLKSNSKQSGESMQSVLKKEEGCGLAEKEGFKPGMKERAGDRLLLIMSMTVSSITTV